MSKSVQRSKSAVSPSTGRYIFAYCNIRTNQVLYSLQRELRNRALRQLPDLGANNKPPSIRGDLWKPLWTLVYGDNLQGYAHGRRALEKLQEWRILHEYTTKPPEDNDKLWSQDRIDELQKKLDQRGGSKITTVWKMIAREKKKARVRNIMDQKQNSIADLAAVLMEQDRVVETHSAQWTQSTRQREIRAMLEMADHPMRFIDRIRARLAAMAKQMTRGAPREGRMSVRTLAREQLALLRALKSLQVAIPLVREARVRLYYARLVDGVIDTTATGPGDDKGIDTTTTGAGDDKVVDTTDTTIERNEKFDEEQPETYREAEDNILGQHLGELQPAKAIQAKLTPSSAVDFMLNKPLYASLQPPKVPQVTLEEGAPSWKVVESSILSAPDIDALRTALAALGGRKSEVANEITGVLEGISTEIKALNEVMERAKSLPDVPQDERTSIEEAFTKEQYNVIAEVVRAMREIESRALSEAEKVRQQRQAGDQAIEEASKRLVRWKLEFQAPSIEATLKEKLARLEDLASRVSESDLKALRLEARIEKVKGQLGHLSQYIGVIAEGMEKERVEWMEKLQAEWPTNLLQRSASQTAALASTPWVNLAIEITPKAIECRETVPLELAPHLPSPSLGSISSEDMPKGPIEKSLILKQVARVNILNGARIQWQDPLDAEHAQQWPSAIEHVPMGIAERSVAPDPQAPAIMDSVDYSERVKFRRQYYMLLKAEAAEADGNHKLAAALRSNVDLVWKNEHGVYEKSRLEDRLEEEFAGLAGDEEADAEAEQGAAQVEADLMKATKASAKSPWQRISSMIFDSSKGSNASTRSLR